MKKIIKLVVEDIKVKELILGEKWISDMKSVVGSDMTLKIYISPGGKNQQHGMMKSKKMSKHLRRSQQAGNIRILEMLLRESIMNLASPLKK